MAGREGELHRARNLHDELGVWQERRHDSGEAHHFDEVEHARDGEERRERPAGEGSGEGRSHAWRLMWSLPLGKTRDGFLPEFALDPNRGQE